MEMFGYEYAASEGLADNIERANRMDPGSEEKLREWKSIDIQYNSILKEAETGAKLQEAEERIAIEKEKLAHSKMMAEREQENREREAEEAAKRDKLKVGLSIGALALSAISLVLGWTTDHVKTDDIRNTAAERDQKDFCKDVKGFIKDLIH